MAPKIPKKTSIANPAPVTTTISSQELARLQKEIRSALPTIAFKNGHYVGGSVLGETIAKRWPQLSKPERKKILKECPKTQVTGGKGAENRPAGNVIAQTPTAAKSGQSGQGKTMQTAPKSGQNGQGKNMQTPTKSGQNGQDKNVSKQMGARKFAKPVAPSTKLKQAAPKFDSSQVKYDHTVNNAANSSITATAKKAQLVQDEDEDEDSSSYFSASTTNVDTSNAPTPTVGREEDVPAQNKAAAHNKISAFTKLLAKMDIQDNTASTGDMNTLSLMDLQSSLLNMEDEGKTEEASTHRVKNAVLFSGNVLDSAEDGILPQYGLLGNTPVALAAKPADARVFLNANIPFSAFICGIQGSGKSHTTACMIENCLIKSPVLGSLQKPLSALAFNFGEYTSRTSFKLSEVAFLASPNEQNPNHPKAKKVNVLVAPSNFLALKELYEQIPGVEAHPFKLHPNDLNVSTMLTLMSVDNSQSQPLYLATVTKVLRQMATESSAGFDYLKFRRLLRMAKLDKKQVEFLNQRLDLLESFLDLKEETTKPEFKAGEITIIDLSCPFLDASTACVLFKIGMGIYLDSDPSTGKLIVLDEAHKYMTDTPASKALTESLRTIVRLQRHYGARILVSTQEPSIAPGLIDLCNMTVIHRFTSPDWMNALKKHISISEDDQTKTGETKASLYDKILKLNTGEALVFAPSAIVGATPGDGEDVAGGGGRDWQTADNELIRLRVRKRVTWDAGASVVCV